MPLTPLPALPVPVEMVGAIGPRIAGRDRHVGRRLLGIDLLKLHAQIAAIKLERFAARCFCGSVIELKNCCPCGVKP